MGRRKKIKEEPIQETNKESKVQISYRGELTVKQLNGKSVTKVMNFHNTGRLSLFRFICEALAGNLNNTIRPCKIALFTKEKNDTEEKYDNESTWKFDDNLRVTNYVIYSSTAIASKVSDNEAAVTYTFRIPYSYINFKSDSLDTGKIYKAGLYPVKPSGENRKYTVNDQKAYFGFVKKDLSDWEPIDIDNISATVASNSSILIEWTIVVSNQVVTK